MPVILNLKLKNLYLPPIPQCCTVEPCTSDLMNNWSSFCDLFWTRHLFNDLPSTPPPLPLPLHHHYFQLTELGEWLANVRSLHILFDQLLKNISSKIFHFFIFSVLPSLLHITAFHWEFSSSRHLIQNLLLQKHSPLPVELIKLPESY